MKIIQFLNPDATPTVGLVQQGSVRVLNEVDSVYQLVQLAWDNQHALSEMIDYYASETRVSYQEIAKDKRLLPPLTHPDPYHTWVTGTGLTHLGSAASRDTMHKITGSKKESDLTDSMRMFEMGVKGGQMTDGNPGVQPEWFYKGNGLSVVAPEQPIPQPTFALDGGEEPEIVGLYIIDKTREPQRIGFTLGNEFSDHKMEKINYLYLAHSKLRKCAYGPELLVGKLPPKIEGTSKIIRDNEVLWEKNFLTGEEHMSHNLENLEHHHFKYELFRQPGDVHIHFFGTSVVSFADQIKTQPEDVFEISADCFTHPLVNPLAVNE
ncbi:AraD1 family protein [Tunicatimonas pelagia]|uniref:AraD1 family protein n=1 Tax=Tunicatimonas pelagia TaxID=931531 RepID=UPI002664EB0B|nr:AraD1 family protein [Tunicatimonas pelagia]WKN43775.1 GguC family protein [Tunicatimonas pelagia]